MDNKNNGQKRLLATDEVSAPKQSSVRITRTAVFLEGMFIGEIGTGGVYLTHRYSVKHFMRKYLGYPISFDVLKTLQAEGIYWIKIVEHRMDNSERYYYAPIGMYLDAITMKEGHNDVQKCLPLKEMLEVTV